MPSLQLDAPVSYDTARKRALAEAFGRTYARIMDADVELVTVVIRDAGAGGVWRCTAGDPVPASLLMCDVRSGRSVATRAELAEALIAICAELGDLDPSTVKIEFTQHAGEDMYHPHLAGFNDDWSPSGTADSEG